MSELQQIEIVEDHSKTADLTQGFMRLQRLTLRNRYEDGSASAPYACDVLSRRLPDAVAIVIYEVDAARRVRVALRTGIRPPVYFRGTKEGLVRPETRDLRLLTEIVAGLLEETDRGTGGVERRAAIECAEEAGYEVKPADIASLGAPSFPSPGTTDEQVFYRVARVEDLDRRGAPTGDEVMEEAGEVVLLPLDEAIHRCRAGEIPDSKTELALLRLCDAIGYSVQLGCFLDALPPEARPAPQRGRWLMGERVDG